jgi:hypothetical protein
MAGVKQVKGMRRLKATTAPILRSSNAASDEIDEPTFSVFGDMSDEAIDAIAALLLANAAQVEHEREIEGLSHRAEGGRCPEDSSASAPIGSPE